MVEVMNRAARRAARKAQPAIETGIYIVPLEFTEAYYHAQVAQEGMWNPDPPVIVTRPKEEFGRADEVWLQRTLAQMRRVREPGTNRYVFPGESGRADTDIDIGLIDLQVYFNGRAGRRTERQVFDESTRSRAKGDSRSAANRVRRRESRSSRHKTRSNPGGCFVCRTDARKC
jgi:hypothetical protein